VVHLAARGPAALPGRAVHRVRFESVTLVGDGSLPEDEALRTSLRSLAEILLGEQDVNDLLGNVTSLAAAAVPGCDAASITLMKGGRPTTPVCSAEVAREVDQSQYDTHGGPCLAAMVGAEVVRVDSFADDDRWPEMSARAVSNGVASSLSLPLSTGSEVVGALNLYSRQPANFGGAEEQAAVFAAQAAVTVSNAQALERTQDLARHLAVALENRDVIGQAKGIIMAADGVSSDEAFAVLRRASQRSNRKLHDVAREIVDRRRQGTGAPD
jgi:GAF domain-containing protein